MLWDFALRFDDVGKGAGNSLWKFEEGPREEGGEER
jgi:hypothetical protein